MAQWAPLQPGHTFASNTANCICCRHRGPYTHREAPRDPGMLITQGCLSVQEMKSDTCIPYGKLRGDSVSDLVTYLLVVETLSPTSCYGGRPHPHSPECLSQTLLPRPLPILRADVTCTSWPADFRYRSETILDSIDYRYRSHPYGHMYFVTEFLCSHTLSFIVHLELDWLLPGNLFPNCPVFHM